MANTRTLIAQAYSAFNQRDIDGALALMSKDVNWPKASEGGRVVGKEEIRAYWTRQWQEFDPHVEPMEVIEREGGKTEVRVHQLVKSLGGDVLSDSEVWHVYTVANGLIERMEIGESAARLGPGSVDGIFQTLVCGGETCRSQGGWVLGSRVEESGHRYGRLQNVTPCRF
jgi:hypothetical protein